MCITEMVVATGPSAPAALTASTGLLLSLSGITTLTTASMIPRPKGHNPALLRFSHALTAALALRSCERMC